MKRILITPILAAALLAAACENGDPTAADTRPSVRFFNATTGMTGSGAFTANGQFAVGSALAFGQSTQTCTKLDAGSTSFGFGAANAGGTGLSGNTLATLNDQSISTGGSYTVVAMGSAASPSLFLLDDSFTGSLGSNQAAVRFVNLAPGTGTTANTFVVYQGAFGGGQSPAWINLAGGVPGTFRTVASGSNTFSLLRNPGHNIVDAGSAVTLQGGAVNTVAIVPTASGGFQMINISGC